MKRRNLLKGTAAAVVCPLSCSREEAQAEPYRIGFEIARKADDAIQFDTGDLYVEFGYTGCGKTTRLLQAVRELVETTDGLAMIVAGTIINHHELWDQVVSWDMPDEQKGRIVFFHRACKFDQPKPPARKVFAHGYSQKALFTTAQSIRADRDYAPVRFFFDDWDQDPFPTPYIPGSYYTTTPARLRTWDETLPEAGQEPTLFQRLMMRAESFTQYRILDPERAQHYSVYEPDPADFPRCGVIFDPKSELEGYRALPERELFVQMPIAPWTDVRSEHPDIWV